jgi:RNA polymerase sigma-70 factor, ECF subfamily
MKEATSREGPSGPMSDYFWNAVDKALLSTSAGTEKEHSLSGVEEEVIGLFDALRVRLLRYSVSFGLSMQDSEDVVQEVFLALFHHLQAGRSRRNLRGWVFRVAHNLSLKRRASNQTGGKWIESGSLLPEQFCDPAPGPEQLMVLGESQSRMLAALRALPETDERCLRLRAEGLNYREIAGVLGISLGSVSISLARSLARLERAGRR